MGTIADQIEGYVVRIEGLRARAADAQRDAYTVALGQLVAMDLIDRDRYERAMSIPRVAR
jgi:hypothetical protein